MELRLRGSGGQAEHPADLLVPIAFDVVEHEHLARAVATDSANLYLNTHLAATMRRKLELLRQAAALVAAVS